MNGSYLEWKPIQMDNSEDESPIRKNPIRNVRAVLGESKSLPSNSGSSSNTSQTQTSCDSSSSETNVSSMIKLKIIKPVVSPVVVPAVPVMPEPISTFSTQIADRNSFASNTIKRYSRFRAKQATKQPDKPSKPEKREKCQKPAKRPKSLETPIYANVSAAVDKNTLVQRWIDKNQSGVYTDTVDSGIEPSKSDNVSDGLSDGPKPISISKVVLENQDDDDVPLELRCPVCLDLYQKPLFLPCGHTYCKGCIQKVVDSSDKDTKRKQRFVCPTCRNIIKYGNEGIDALPKNLNLECAVQRYENGHGVKAPICQSHIKYRQEKVIWCEDCSICICPLCMFDGNHENHQMAPVKVMTKFQRVRKKLKKTKMVLAGRVTDLQQSLHQMEKNRDDLENKCSVMSKKIDKECQSMILLIKKQHEDMHTQMESAILKKQKRKNRQIASIAKDINKTNSILTEIQAILDTEKPDDFLEKVKLSKIIDPDTQSMQSSIPPAPPVPPVRTARPIPKIPEIKA